MAIVYFKGVGLTPAAAQGLEVEPSLFRFLHQLKNEGYNVGTLPATQAEFNQLLLTHANTYRANAKGDIEKFISTGAPALVEAHELDAWLKKTLPSTSTRPTTPKNSINK